MKRSTLKDFYDKYEEKKRNIQKSRKIKNQIKEKFYNEYIVIEKPNRKEKTNHR